MELLTAAVAQKGLDKLLQVVLEARSKAKKYEAMLKSIATRINAAKPILESITEFEQKHDREDEEIKNLWEKIKQGEEVVRKCSKKEFCSCFKKSRCMEELEDLDESLNNFFSYVLPLKQFKSQIQSREEVKEGMEDIKGKVKETDDGMKDIQGKMTDTIEVVKDIQGKMTDTNEGVKDIQGKMTDATDGVKDIQGKMTDTSEGVKEIQGKMADTNEGVKDIQRRVENIQGSIEDIGKKLNSNNSATLSLCAPPEPPELIVGLDKPLEELKEKLFKEGVSVLVLTASGGCGKTTLAKILCRDEEVKGKFKGNIFFVTVSKKPNLKVIVQKIFQHMGHSHVPEFQNDENAVNHLGQLLKNIGPIPILLVLDDVWPGSESLLHNFKFQIADYKILVTSTSEFPGFGSTIKLKPLKNEDAMTLFMHSAFPPDQSSYLPDEEILHEIVKACSGNPLALTVVGRSLYGQPAEIWQNRAMEWSKDGSIVGSNDALRNCLQQSLEVLDNKDVIKECYMDLGSFPEGQWIPATALIDMWVELYELDEDGVKSIANLHELDTLNLLNLEVRRKDAKETDSHYNDHFVMQHDLLRQLVKDQSSLESFEERKRLIVNVSGNKFPKGWSEQKQLSIRARLLSITTDETATPNWSNIQAPEVEVLVLNCRANNYKLPEFKKKMDKLKALVLTNYGFLPAEISNFSLLCSFPNLKRIWLENVSIPSLCLASAQLEHLQKISLVMCHIGQAFSDTTMQLSSALPNLLEINIYYCTDLKNLPVWFCDLVHLKKLSIINSCELFELPKEIGKLVNLEVLRLCFCIELVELPETIGNLSTLSVLDISDCVTIKELPKQIGELHNLRKLFMNGCSITELPLSIENLKCLKDVICDNESADLWRPFMWSLPNLRIKV